MTQVRKNPRRENSKKLRYVYITIHLDLTCVTFPSVEYLYRLYNKRSMLLNGLNNLKV